MKELILAFLALIICVCLIVYIRKMPVYRDVPVKNKPTESTYDTNPKEKNKEELKLVDPEAKLKEMLEFPKLDPRSIDFSPLDSKEYKFR